MDSNNETTRRMQICPRTLWSIKMCYKFISGQSNTKFFFKFCVKSCQSYWQKFTASFVMDHSIWYNMQIFNTCSKLMGSQHRLLHEMKNNKTRRALGRVHVPPTKVFPRLAVNKTIYILKPCLAAATSTQYLYVRFSRRNKIPRCSAYDIKESNLVPASWL